MNICPDCFETVGLQRKIAAVRKVTSEGQCHIHPHKKGIPIETLAAIVDPVFRELYWGSPNEGSVWDDHRGSPLIDTLYDMTGAIDDTILDALSTALAENDFYRPQKGEEPFYDEEYRYVLQGDDASQHVHNWNTFRRSLMFETRFFNPDAERSLSDIFYGIQQLRDDEGRGPVYLIKPEAEDAYFYRARAADSYEDMRRIKADLTKELGPPPEQLRKAGRLNPAGISAFYGAFDHTTCVAELRPWVGGRVISARFKLTREILVLDTTRFEDKPGAVNLFAAGARKRARQWAFMRMFMDEIARPISPGEEHLQYLPTQAVAEFLNKRFQVTFAGKKRNIDAVIFRSAQWPEGKNIVILGDAALVGESDDLKAPKPVEKLRPVELNDFDDWFEHELEINRADKPVGLRPEPDTVRWTKVQGARFTSDDVPDEHLLDNGYDR